MERKSKVKTREIKQLQEDKIESNRKMTVLKKENKEFKEKYLELKGKVALDKGGKGSKGKLMDKNASMKASSFLKKGDKDTDSTRIKELEDEISKLKKDKNPKLYNKHGLLWNGRTMRF